MKLQSNISTLFLRMTVLTWLAVNISAARAVETIWNGPTTNFVQGAAPKDKDILIPGIVAIRRQPGSYLYNPLVEGGAGAGTPSDTEWAFGTMANHSSLTYKPFSEIHSDAQAAGQHLSTYLTSGPMVLHIKNQDIYVSVTFNFWPQQGSTFTYTRSTPAAVAPTPSITITNPVNGAIFAEPADVTIAANATVSSGTVTNVTFFRDTTAIGSKQTAPFTITANGLTSGSYALKAVATAAGISATSSVVNISVVIPPTISVTITNPADGAVFAAPANITIGANATTSSGTVTNVSFFGNSTLFGSAQTAPFTISANGLTNGNYALKAVATAAGISATSSVVNVSVVAPVVTSLSTVPATVADNQFIFSYSATPGLSYEVDVSSNLIDWTPFVTNVAQNNLIFITNDISGDGSYFRVGRMPNP